MSKTKKSKLLASMLCATVVAGLYAGPVMAGDGSINAGEGAVNEGKGTGIKITIDKLHNAGGDINTDPGLFIDHQPLTNEYKVFGNLEITADQLAAGIKGSDVEFGKVTADTLNVGGKDVVKLNGSRVDVNADVINGGFLKVTNANGEMVFAVDSKGVVKAANGNFGIADDGTVSVGGDETNGKAIINGTTGDITTKGNVYAVNGSFDNITTGTITAANGSFKVDQGNGETVVAGSMIYSKNQNGSYGMLNGNQLTLQGDGNKFSVVNGNVETSGTVNAAKDVVANGYSLAKIGENTQKISYDPVYEATKIDSHVMVNGAVIAGNDSLIGGVKLSDSRITASTALIAGVEIANGKVDGVDISELKDNSKDIAELQNKTTDISYDNGVTDIAGVAQFGNGSMKVTGTMQVSGDKFVYTYQDENGNLRVGSLKAIDSSIDELYDKTTDISYANGETTVGGATSFDANGMVIESMNGTTAIVGGQATFSNQNGFTNINGGQIITGDITADTLNGVDIDELMSGVGATNKNTAGIERKEVQTIDGTGYATVIEGGTVIGSDGSFSTANGKFTIEKDGRVSVAESIHVAKGGQIGAAEFDETGMVIESMNGTTAIVGGQATFSNQNGFTNINGGQIITGDITADTLNGVDIDELISGVGTTNKNTAGIERKEVQTIDGTGYATVIEDGTVIGSDGSFSTAFGKLTVEKDGRFSLSSDAWFGGDVNYKYVNKDGSISYGSLQDLTDRVSDLEDKTQNIDSGSTHGPSEPSEGEGPVDNGAHTGINGDVTVGGDANVKGDVNVDGNVNVGDKTQIGNGNISVGEDGNKTTIDNGNITVDNGESGKVEIGNGDVTVTDKDGNEHSIQGNAQDIADIREDMGAMSNRISKVEDRIDKVGAMSAAIANLRTMGYDPTAPTEIAVGIGQYRSETGAALGLFHYPNKDFMLSLSVSTSGDEVMGGIGATWKFGRKSPEQMLAAEKEKAAKAKLAKAEAMKKAAAEAKVAEQQAKHAKMAAEKAAK